jgi:hypothetical protein
MACCNELSDVAALQASVADDYLEEWKVQWADYNLRANILTGLQVAIGTAGMISGILSYNKMWKEVAKAAEAQKEIVANVLAQQNAVYIPCETSTVPAMCGLHNGAAAFLATLREKLNAHGDLEYADFSSMKAGLITNVNAVQANAVAANSHVPFGYTHAQDRSLGHESTYDVAYRPVESTNLPVMVTNGGASSNGMQSSAGDSIGLADQMQNDWRVIFAPCEQTTLTRACELWTQARNPLQRLCEADDKAEMLANESKRSYQEFLACQKDYEQEVCAQGPYKPNFECVEAEARAHISKSFGAQRKRLQECASPYCTGSTLQTDIQLSVQQATAEVAAVAAANRYEHVKVAQEANRRHRYITELAQLNEQKDNQAIAALSLSAQINQQKLAFITATLARGWNYINAASSYRQLGQLGFQSNMNSGLSAAQVGQNHNTMSLNWWARREQSLQHVMTLSARLGTLINDYNRLAHANYTTAGLDAQRIISSTIAHLDRMPALLGAGTRAGGVSGGLFSGLLDQAAQLSSGGLGAIGEAAGQWVIGDLGAPTTTQPVPSQGGGQGFIGNLNMPVGSFLDQVISEPGP